MKTMTIIPAGEYWIGDPCYTVPDEDWMKWLTACNFTQEPYILVGYIGENKYALGVSTFSGDGTYFDQQGREFWVDSGVLGVVDVRWAEEGDKEEHGTRYRLTLEENTLVEWSPDGIITLGPVTIDTGGEDDDDE